MIALRSGNPPKPYHLAECSECKALYMLSNDGFLHQAGRIDDRQEFHCPCCNNRIWLKALTEGEMVKLFIDYGVPIIKEDI